MRRFGIIKYLLAIGAGAGIAVAGTVMHQTTIQTMPFGVLMAMLLVFAIAINYRKARSQGWLFTAALAITIFIAGLDSNQDTMIPANNNGFIWAYGSITLAAFVMMFPKFRKN